MVVALVSLEDVKKGLRIDTTDFDTDLEYRLGAASEAIIGYLKGGADGFFMSGDEIDLDAVPDRVQVATIMLVGYLFRNVDSDPDKDFEHGYLPQPVMSLLYSMRDPALA